MSEYLGERLGAVRPKLVWRTAIERKQTVAYYQSKFLVVKQFVMTRLG